MKKLFFSALVMCLAAGLAFGQDDDDGGKKKKKGGKGQEMVITGELAEVETTNKKGDTVQSMVLKTEDYGEVKLPAPRKKGKAVDLSGMVGETVTLKVIASERKTKKGNSLNVSKVLEVVGGDDVGGDDDGGDDDGGDDDGGGDLGDMGDDDI